LPLAGKGASRLAVHLAPRYSSTRYATALPNVGSQDPSIFFN